MQGDNTTNGAQNVNALLDARPDAVNPIIGYNILPTAKTLTDLKTGQAFDTTDTAKSGSSVNGAPQTLQITVSSNSGTAAQVSIQPKMGRQNSVRMSDYPWTAQ